MKSLFKKISAVLMVAVLMFCAIPFTASANSGYCGDNVTYSFDSSTGVLTISGTGPMYDWDPNDNPFRNSDIDVYAKEIIINYGVTAIGECAFSCLSNVTDVYIPNSVTEIRMGAFSECWSLININIPDSVISIGLASFECCESLESITIPNSVTYVAESAFDECISLKSVTISNNLTEISDYMFAGCTAFETFDIATTVTKIGTGAFSGCQNLTSLGTTAPNRIHIGDGVVSIGEAAFNGCILIETIRLPFVGNTATAIDNKAVFGYIFGVSSYTGGTACDQKYGADWDDHKVYYVPSSLKTVYIGNAPKLGYGAFYNCTTIETLRINYVDEGNIGTDAFKNCVEPVYVSKGEI